MLELATALMAAAAGSAAAVAAAPVPAAVVDLHSVDLDPDLGPETAAAVTAVRKMPALLPPDTPPTFLTCDTATQKCYGLTKRGVPVVFASALP